MTKRNRFHLVLLFLVCFFITNLYNVLIANAAMTEHPNPDVKINNTDGPITISKGNIFSLQIGLSPGNYPGQESDWWIVVYTHSGWKSLTFKNDELIWVNGIKRIIKAPLINLDLVTIPPPPVSKVENTIIFAVDDNADGNPDATWWDAVKLYIISPLQAIDKQPINERTPLILIHGNQSETEPDYRWDAYITRLRKDSYLSSKFKAYLFQWDSEESNHFNAVALGRSIESEKVLQNKYLMLLAHSRGGIVARYYMNNYITQAGAYSGKLAGERVNRLITLGTPHRGVPGADPIWTIFSLDNNYSSYLAEQISLFYLSHIYDPSYAYLLWDDANDQLTNEEVCWNPAVLEDQTEFCSVLLSNESSLLKLNNQEQYFDKIIAYGGNEYVGQPFQLSFDLSEHKALSLSSSLLADIPVIPNNYPSTPINDDYRPFEANDGLVPLVSALLLKPSPEEIFTIENGQLRYNSDQLENLCQVQECIIIDDRRTDHLDLLEDNKIIDEVIVKIKEY